MDATERSHETVSAINAKTYLPRLLQEVEEGHIITITKRGRPVARLIPYKNDKKRLSKVDILAQFNKIRRNVKGKVDIQSYIAEGRKH